MPSVWSGMAGTLPAELDRLGVTYDSVDTVLFTHLHSDHVGWSCVERNGGWEPMFPNARYLVNRPEWDRWAPVQAGYLERLCGRSSPRGGSS